MRDLAEKSRTSPAMRDGRFFGSMWVMVWTPGVPARRVCQKASGPDPIGLMTPNPVSTVRRELVVMSVTRLGLAVAEPRRVRAGGSGRGRLPLIPPGSPLPNGDADPLSSDRNTRGR